MMMTVRMQSGQDQQARQRMQQAQALCSEARGVSLDLGKKISTPRDLMMEELKLPSNRGSRMFQERQKRAERFTLESTASDSNGGNFGKVLPPQPIPEPQAGRENLLTPRVGKHSLVLNLQKTIAKKGSPEALAPGYSGPLREVPRERFNSTVIPRSYSAPWGEGPGPEQQLLAALTEQLPLPPQPAASRCFNRSARPFGGPAASRRVLPVISFEAAEAQNLQQQQQIARANLMSQRPNFNRAPRGWTTYYCPESSEL